MNTSRNLFPSILLPALLVLGLNITHAGAVVGVEALGGKAPPGQTNAPMPWDQIGARAGADYHGDGLSVSATPRGARLRCVFQRLEGEATREGLWLTSTVTNTLPERFQVKAMAVGRQEAGTTSNIQHPTSNIQHPTSNIQHPTSNIQHPTSNIQLEKVGQVKMEGQTVRFVRPGLVEEYSVSMDGVRQDFVVAERPGGAGQLRVELAVSGARAEPLADGARLELEGSGRKIAYSRLRAADARGKELLARLVVEGDAEAGRGSVLDCGSPVPLSVTSGPADSGRGLPQSKTLQSVGRFAVVVEDAEAEYPVRIDPTFCDANWISLNSSIPFTGGSVHAAAVDGAGNLYIGGNFTAVGNVMANNVAQWNGTSWTALGSGVNQGVYALAVLAGTLYAGGTFSWAGSGPAWGIAQWNGGSWSPLGSGLGGGAATYPYVFALAVSGSTLYVGGQFGTAGGGTANNIAQWNGSSWSPLALGTSAAVNSLAVSGGTLYAGGFFSTAGTYPVGHIAQWNGSKWLPLGAPGIGGSTGFENVAALVVSGGTLYVGGNFTTAGLNAVTNIAQWNGSSFSWSPLGSGMNNSVAALAVSGGTLYAGGYFTTAGGTAANHIAQWNGSSWSPVGSGINGQVEALVVSGGVVYAAGGFTTAGSNPANNVAGWDGSSWNPLGSQVNNTVRALAVSGGTLYAGGDFTTAGGTPANYVAQWNGSSWNPLGSGMNGSVSAMAVSGGTLYAGGAFTTAGTNTANCVAQWNGSSWSPLGSGLGGGDYNGLYASALAVSGGTLYAGGDFTTAGGTAVNYIAQWNGSHWNPLGSGMNSSVYALAMSGGTLYAGGYFTAAGTNAANCVAQWNGSSWNPLGAGVGGGDYWGPYVSALAVSGGTVYAGGDFTSAEGNVANYVAQWDGSSWSALGSGVNNVVNALAVSGGAVYAGGNFTTAGGKASSYAAKAILDLTYNGISIQRLTGGNARLSFLGDAARNYALDRTFDLKKPVTWVPQCTNAACSDGTLVLTNTAAPGTNNFWRMRSVR
jgi:hypothetical protein